MNTIQETDELKIAAWDGMSKHCADCTYKWRNSAFDDEPEGRECLVKDNSDCPAVSAVQDELARLEDTQQFDYDHLETALGKVTDDMTHFADHNNTEGLLKSFKDALRQARFEQAKEEELI